MFSYTSSGPEARIYLSLSLCVCVCVCVCEREGGLICLLDDKKAHVLGSVVWTRCNRSG